MNIYSEKYIKNDECYTPRWVVELLLPFIPDGVRTVWCPFDTERSEYVRVLTAAGYDVIASHILTGQDFLSWSPDREFDAIISNPPYHNKLYFIERALSFGVPTALLLPDTILRDRVFMVAYDSIPADELGLVFPFDRVDFLGDDGKPLVFIDENGETKKNAVNFKPIYFTTGMGGGIHRQKAPEGFVYKRKPFKK